MKPADLDSEQMKGTFLPPTASGRVIRRTSRWWGWGRGPRFVVGLKRNAPKSLPPPRPVTSLGLLCPDGALILIKKRVNREFSRDGRCGAAAIAFLVVLSACCGWCE